MKMNKTFRFLSYGVLLGVMIISFGCKQSREKDSVSRRPTNDTEITRRGHTGTPTRIEKTVGTTKIVLLGDVDITTLNVNVIVNAANKQLKAGHGVCGAIHKAAGSGLARECKGLPDLGSGVRCFTGDAKITSSCNLKSNRIRYIVHAVGPDVSGRTVCSADQENLASAYTSSLTVAKTRDPSIRSIAFPCISTAIFGYPGNEAARVAFKAVCDYIAANPGSFDEIIFACFTRKDYDYYKVLFDIS